MIGLYSLTVIGVGMYFSKFVKGANDFFGASKVTPWWAAGLSYFMTAFSAAAFIGGASFTYRHGGLSLLSVALAVPVFMLGYWVFSRRWYRTGCKTVVEYLQQRFGSGAARFFVITGIPIRILDNANRVYVTAVLLETLCGLPLWIGAVVTTFVSFASAVAGGYLGVVATDALQAIVLGLITAIIAAFALARVGGVEELLAKLPEGYWSLNPEGSPYGLAFILALALLGIFSWNGYWSLVQRFVSVKSERDAQLVSLTSGVSYYLLFPLFALPPIAAVVLVPGLVGAEQTEQSYLLLSQLILPAGLMAVFVSALVGASVTGINSEFNTVSQIVVEDILRPVCRQMSQKRELFLSRLFMLIMALCCLGISLGIRSMGGSYNFLVTLMGMTTLPTFVPLLASLLWPKMPGWGAIWGCLAGTGMSMVLGFGFNLGLEWVIGGNFLVTSLVVLVSGLVDPVDRRPAVVELFGRLRKSQIPDQAEAGAGGDLVPSPMLTVLGWSLLILAAVTLFALLESESGLAPTLCMLGGLAGFGVLFLALARWASRRPAKS